MSRRGTLRRRSSDTEKPAGDTYKVLLVCSSGGHLSQLLQLEPWWSGRERVWVTFDKPDARGRLEGERVLFGHHPTTRNIPNLLRNALMAFRTLRDERPDVIITTGAGIAVPYFWFGRAFGCRTVYLEVYDRIDSRTVTARLCRPVTDLFLVQWPEQVPMYRNAVLAGPVY